MKKLTLKEAISTIDKTEFERDYCSDDALDLDELSDKYSLTPRKCERLAEHYGFRRSSAFVRRKVRRTCLERYGVDSVLKLDDMKARIAQTNIERYGSANVFASPQIQERIKESNLLRHGVEYPQQNPEIRGKSFNTCLERYGSKNNIAKIKETNMRKYGVDNVSKVPDIIDKICDAAQRKYGVPAMCLQPGCRSKSNGAHSRPNERFARMLDEMGISYEREFAIGNRAFDFMIADQRCVIEIDPTATHNATFTPYDKQGKKPMDPGYHSEKSKIAEAAGYRCVHVFDWDDDVKIARMFSSKRAVYARKCDMREVPKSECDAFLADCHLQSTCKGQSIRLGLYYEGRLIEIMTFGKPRYSKKCEYELLRLCTDPEYRVIGGAQRLFGHFVSEHDPASVISYCDLSKFSGQIYGKLGFELKRENKPSKHWVELGEKKTPKKQITDNLLRQRGFDQIFGTSYGKGTSNEELMLKHGFAAVYDCGQATWIYERKN